MKIWYSRKDQHAVVVRVDPFNPAKGKHRFLDVIFVMKRSELGEDGFEKAVVTWSSSADQTPSRSILMAAGLRRAAKIAAQLDKGVFPKYPEK